MKYESWRWGQAVNLAHTELLKRQERWTPGQLYERTKKLYGMLEHNEKMFREELAQLEQDALLHESELIEQEQLKKQQEEEESMLAQMQEGLEVDANDLEHNIYDITNEEKQ